MVFTFLRALVIFCVIQFSITSMHRVMVEKVTRAKIVFFDSNPVGRILTRFSKDVTALDLVMPNIANLAAFGIFKSITVAMVIGYVHYEMLVVIIFVLGLMIYIKKQTGVCQQEAQRMDSIYRGPIHSSFTNVVNGLVSLRAYERLDFFRDKFMHQLE